MFDLEHETMGCSAQLPSGENGAPTFPVVALGASAGGLNALESFFSGLPRLEEVEMAFVVIQHIAPDRRSLLAELLASHTDRVVVEIEDRMPVLPGRVHVIPPNCRLDLEDGRFRTHPFDAPRPLRQPIDDFLRSLSWWAGERAVGVILSGTGSDGSVGLEAIKHHGGFVLAQAPETSEFDGMPAAAIATGLVDRVLPPEAMFESIRSWFSEGKDGLDPLHPSLQDEEILHDIFLQLHQQVGHDFSQYKSSTLYRRVLRRLASQQLPDLRSYAEHLRATPAEASSLFRELLIGVTRFFRDPEVFRCLAERVVPQLLAKEGDAPLRIWVPGCATGEEAYSLAMLLLERLEETGSARRIQIYATDIDPRAVATARSGVFPASVVAELEPERFRRHFVEDERGGFLRIHKRIREMLIFSEQNLIKDPPFSRMDLISCRNLLIYLGSDLQRRLVALFHASLNPSGILLLGTSEQVPDGGEFEAIDRTCRLYRRLETGRRKPSPLLLPSSPYRSSALSVLTGKGVQSRNASLREFTERAILSRIAPTALLLDADGEILYQHGRVGRFLEPPPDAPATTNALRMAREGLRQALSSALRKASCGGGNVQMSGLRVRDREGLFNADLRVQSVGDGAPDDPGSSRPLYLAVLEEIPETRDEAPSPALEGGGDSSVAELLQELEARDEQLRAIRSALETSNEELTASNEELQSINEELQSANEELETSKEELQSVYEELTTVNTELRAKVVELGQANDDILNLLAGTGIATVFVDRNLRLMRFTPEATRIVNLIPSDNGRPIGHILSNLVGYDSLVDNITAVLRDLTEFARDVQVRDGSWYNLRILPYRTRESGIEGAVVTFTDVTARRKAEAELRERDARLRAVLENCPEPIYLKDRESRILVANPATLEVIGLPEEQVLGRTDLDLYEDQDLARVIMENDRTVVESGKAIVREEVVPGPDGTRTYLSTKAPWHDDQGRVAGIVGVSRDITESRRMEAALRDSEQMFRGLIESIPLAIYVSTGPEHTALYMNPSFTGLFGYEPHEVPDAERWWPLAYPDPTYQASVARTWQERVSRCFETGDPIEPLETVVTCRDGSKRDVQWHFYVLGGRNFCYGIDLTEIRRGERALREALEQKETLLLELREKEAQARSMAEEMAALMEAVPSFLFVGQDHACRKMLTSRMARERLRLPDEYMNPPGSLDEPKPAPFRIFQDGREIDPADYPLRRAIREDRLLEDIEFEMRLDDGTSVTLLGNALPVRDAEGKARGALGAFHDITAHKRTEEDLRRSREEMALVLDNTAEAIAFLDEQRRLVWANRAYLETLSRDTDKSRSLEELKGRPCFEPFGFGHHCEECPAERARETGTVQESMLSFHGAEGECWHVRSAPVRDEANRFLGTIEVARSISEQQRMEEQIRQSEKLAAVGQLAGGVAHNFNNQLTGVMGFADLLLRRLEDPAQRRLAEGIKDASRRAAQLTAQLLAFARKGNRRNEAIDIDRLIVQTVDLLRQTVDRRIELEHVPSSAEVRVQGDPSQLQNAFLNLGLNARDAMPEGGRLRYETSTLRLDEVRSESLGLPPGEYARILVADTGKGMSPEVQKRAFEPFFTTKPVGEGTGLGLASVHGTMASLGGTVTLETHEGEGTTFELLLPLSPVRAAESEKAPETIAAARERVHVLLVDDEEVVLQTSGAMLVELGYQVTSCRDGHEALDLYRERGRDFDLVLLDLVMPRVGGRDTLKALRELDPGVQVVIASGHALDQSPVAVSEEEVAFLQKPFNMAELSQVVAETLESRGRRRA